MPAARFICALALASLSASSLALGAEPSAEARRLYAEGKAQYAQGHYAEAADLFGQSYALSESPALLFNMAQAHRLAGPEHCADAVTLYKSYLLALPEAENKNEVEERLQALSGCAPRAAAPTPAPAEAAKPAAAPAVPAPSGVPIQTGTAFPTGPVVTTGAGAALLVAGGVLYLRAWEKHREAERVCPCYPGTYARWEVLTNVSYALLAVGGATLAGGVTWWALGEPSLNGRPARALLGVGGRF